MATKNQKHVAEALRIARDVNFNAGLLYYADLDSDPFEQRKWFRAKCIEHHIQVPELDVVILGASFAQAVAKFRDAINALGAAAGKAAKQISEASARANAEVAVHHPKTW